MADPRPLFYVTAFVVLGLVAWVASVLLRRGRDWNATASERKPADAKDAKDAKADDAAHSRPKNS